MFPEIHQQLPALLTSEYAASHTDENIQEIKGRKN